MMNFDRNRLNDLHFVGKCPNEIHHARVPVELVQSAFDLDAVFVYLLLRCRPPSHRWKADYVKSELKKFGLRMGKDRVEKAMAHLKRMGWITYVVLKGPGGRRSGSIVQVHPKQLPQHLRGRDRSIRLQKDDSFAIFDFDGKTELSVEEFNTGSLLEKAAPEDKSKASQPGSPSPHVSGEWLPEDQETGEQYKSNNKKAESLSLSEERGHELIFPSEKPGPDGPERESPNDPGFFGSTIIEEEECFSESASSPLATSPEVDWNRLRELGSAARNSQEERLAFEHHLADFVFPVLTEPPNLEKRWTKPRSVEWCRVSPKAQLVIQLAEEEDWTQDLARRFVKAPARWSVAQCKALLRSLYFFEIRRRPLGEIVSENFRKKKFDETQGSAWERFVNIADSRELKSKQELRSACHNFSGGKLSDSELIDAVHSRFQIVLNGPPPVLHEDGDVYDRFHGLLVAYHRASPERWEDLLSLRDVYASEMNRLVASHPIECFVARSYGFLARWIWGIDWDLVRDLHPTIAEELKWRSEFYGLNERVEPDFSWFDRLPPPPLEAPPNRRPR